jgi:hypothetical protein
MRTIKSKAKQFELAVQGRLFFIDHGRYVVATVGIVIKLHGSVTFYARNK